MMKKSMPKMAKPVAVATPKFGTAEYFANMKKAPAKKAETKTPAKKVTKKTK